MRKYLILLLAILPFSVPAITTYSSVQDMIEDFGDYSLERGTFKVLSKGKSPHIQLSPKVYATDPTSMINEMVNKAAIYGIYRAFIHTDIDSITVTSVPVANKQLLDSQGITLTVNKNDIQNVANALFGVSQLSELVNQQTNVWTSTFNKGYYNDQGYPTLNTHIEKLKAISGKQVTTIPSTDKKAEYSLTVITDPLDARVRIMNIGPKYEDGIQLQPGKYDLSVDKKGYEQHREWVIIEDSDVNINVTLEKKKSKFSCSKRYCKHMSSCAEAYYHLNECGMKKLDRDNDGKPCENVCGK